MPQTKKSLIPTREEFARASQVLEERSRGLEDVRYRVLSYFKPKLRIHDFFIFPHRDTGFDAILFLETDSDIYSVEHAGLVPAIRDYIFSQLAAVGRGQPSDIRLVLELDSDENVNKKYHGNYFNRLR